LTAGRPPKTSSGLSSGAAVVMASELVNSVRRSSSGEPMVRSLVFMIATRSQSRSASSSRWVVRKTVTPRSRSPLTSSSTSCAATGSSPDVGSSRNITSGSLSSERASEARCLSPLDSDPHRSSARSARPTADSASKIRACRPGSPYSRAKKSRFSATVSRVYRPGASVVIEMRCRISASPAGPSGMPATDADPDVGVISVPSIRTVVVLPAPFGPRNPNTSPLPTLNDTSSTALLPPKTLLRWLTSIAAAPLIAGLFRWSSVLCSIEQMTKISGTASA
jgi:hypothetical protein